MLSQRSKNQQTRGNLKTPHSVSEPKNGFVFTLREENKFIYTKNLAGGKKLATDIKSVFEGKKPSFAADFLRTDTIGKDGAGWLLKNKSHFGSSGLIGRLEGLLQKEGDP